MKENRLAVYGLFLSENTFVMIKKALITGYFSTVGDVECLHIVRRWLDQLSISYDVAPYSVNVRRAITGAVDPSVVDEHAYSHLIVVCGPCRKELIKQRLLNFEKFQHCIRIGVNLTMVAPLEEWNPFDVLLERDSCRIKNPDLTFIEPTATIPVVGRCIIREQVEYGQRQQLDIAIRVINDFISSRGYGVIDIDTDLFQNVKENGLQTPSRVLSVIKRVDLLLTNRLHGMVFAIKAGIPVIALDGIKGGDKVTAQAQAIGWPLCRLAEEATSDWMDFAEKWCFSAEAQETIRSCRERVLPSLLTIERDFCSAMTTDINPSPLPMNVLNIPPRFGWLSDWLFNKKSSV